MLQFYFLFDTENFKFTQKICPIKSLIFMGSNSGFLTIIKIITITTTLPTRRTQKKPQHPDFILAKILNIQFIFL